MVGPTAKLVQVFNLIHFLFLFNNITWSIPVPFYNWKPRICHARLHISLYLNFYTSINFRIRIALIRGGIWAFRKLDEEGRRVVAPQVPWKAKLFRLAPINPFLAPAIYADCTIFNWLPHTCIRPIQFSYSLVTFNIVHLDFFWSYLHKTCDLQLREIHPCLISWEVRNIFNLIMFAILCNVQHY